MISHIKKNSKAPVFEIAELVDLKEVGNNLNDWQIKQLGKKVVNQERELGEMWIEGVFILKLLR